MPPPPAYTYNATYMEMAPPVVSDHIITPGSPNTRSASVSEEDIETYGTYINASNGRFTSEPVLGATLPVLAAVNILPPIRLRIPAPGSRITRLDPDTGIPINNTNPGLTSAATEEPEIRRGPGRPRKKPQAMVEAPASAVPNQPVANLPASFELLIHALRPDKCARSTALSKKGKMEKQEPLKFGPVTIPFSTSWTEFTEHVAAAVQVPSAYLEVATFEYHPLVPANSPKVPVINENGLTSMLANLAALASKKPLPIIALRMKEAQYVPPVSLCYMLSIVY